MATKKIMLLSINWALNEAETHFFHGDGALKHAVEVMDQKEAAPSYRGWRHSIMFGTPAEITNTPT
jgi:hypothetical protein